MSSTLGLMKICVHIGYIGGFANVLYEMNRIPIKPQHMTLHQWENKMRRKKGDGTLISQMKSKFHENLAHFSSGFICGALFLPTFPVSMPLLLFSYYSQTIKKEK